MIEESVLIAGGAGTIGSNLAKAIVQECREVIILDYDENTLERTRFEMEQDGQVCKAFLCDLRNSRHLLEIVKKNKPSIIVNCAAHKHLNVGERNISECVFNNLEITRNLLNAMVFTEAHEIVHISTDKAVEPTSVMGASKMLCECMVRDFFKSQHFYDALLRTNYSPEHKILRFGNILGSQGSVWEIWTKQYNEGKPLTITDPAMERYIISVSEATEFIKSVMTWEYGSGTYMLDMKVRPRMDQLMGQFLEERHMLGYPCKVVGAKPGEKKIEALVWSKERTIPSGNRLGTHYWQVLDSPSFPYHYIHWLSKDYDDLATLKAIQTIFPKVRA